MELEKLLNTLINADQEIEEEVIPPYDDEIPIAERKRRLDDSIELDDGEANRFLDDEDRLAIKASKTRLSQMEAFATSKSKIIAESLIDIDIDWNNFQELKLILYSIDFYGQEFLPFKELEKRSLRPL